MQQYGIFVVRWRTHFFIRQFQRDKKMKARISN